MVITLEEEEFIYNYTCFILKSLATRTFSDEVITYPKNLGVGVIPFGLHKYLNEYNVSGVAVFDGTYR